MNQPFFTQVPQDLRQIYRFITKSMILLLLFSFPTTYLYAQTTPPARAELLIGQYHGDIIQAGLSFKVQKDWKIYWRTPGDAGFPPELSFASSDNIQDATISWPFPKRHIDQFGDMRLVSFVYENQVLLPLTLKVKSAGENVRIIANLSYAACKDICLPITETLQTMIPPGVKNTQVLNALQQAASTIPGPNGSHGLTILSSMITKHDHEKPRLEVTVSPAPSNHDSDLFIETESPFHLEPIVMDNDQNQSVYSYHLVNQNPKSTTALEIPLTLTYVHQGKAVELKTSVKTDLVSFQQDQPHPSINTSFSTWVMMIFTALLGGLILNAMPCVLPILSIKLLAVLKHGGSHHKEIRLSFLASALGIITTMLAIAAITIAIRSAGSMVGWGLHFQNPTFITAMIILMVLFASAMVDKIQINLPAWCYATIEKHSPKSKHSLVGHFVTGMFATILATPCTAPFLGTAVSFALSRQAIDILVIFFFLGLGLALPYLLFMVFPNWISKLPKPGPWIEKLKVILSLLLYGSALWLLYVLYHLIGMMPTIGIIFCVSLIRFGFEKQSHRPLTHTIRAVFIIGLLAITLLLPSHVMQKQEAKAKMMAELWQPFEPERITELVSEGKVVVVDVTADWCLTCKFNRVFVFNRTPVIHRLQQPDIVAMEADLTQPNPRISEFLQSYNRYGIPFNIVYGPNALEGIMMPTVFSATQLLNTIDQAKQMKKRDNSE